MPTFPSQIAFVAYVKQAQNCSIIEAAHCQSHEVTGPSPLTFQPRKNKRKKGLH